jgi:hypothetical protein
LWRIWGGWWFALWRRLEWCWWRSDGDWEWVVWDRERRKGKRREGNGFSIVHAICRWCTLDYTTILY